MTKRKKQQKQKAPKKRSAKSSKQRNTTERVELNLSELHGIVERAKEATLGNAECRKLKDAVDTLAILTAELERKNTSLKRLRRLLFGPSTEKTSTVLGDKASSEEGQDNNSPREEKAKKKRKGHGRNSAEDYEGAEKIRVPHQDLKAGDKCPDCGKGKVYKEKEPSRLVRISGVSPLEAKVYELEKLRCNLCGRVFTAKPPEGVGYAKYDDSAAAMMALLKYGCGLPFNRLERLEGSLGIPLPASVQWEVLDKAATSLMQLYAELIRQAGQGKVLYNDDTTMKILELSKEASLGKGSGRSGNFTSGIVSTFDDKQVAVFLTGQNHAGENLDRLLEQREEILGIPIQMCDGLPASASVSFDTIVSNCLAHARRKYVDCANSFPEECEYVLKALKIVYENDAHTQAKKMSDEGRLAYHNAHSKKLMSDLKKWLEKQFREKLVEPNSSLGEAIQYMKKRWKKLTQFLRIPGAPLDNNICERALKKAILHRKNSLFYKTTRGALVGDLFMSFIHTAELAKANPFDYLITVLGNIKEAKQSPENWMPWNYKEATESVEATKISQ